MFESSSIMAETRINMPTQLFDRKGLVLKPENARKLLESYQRNENPHVYFTCNGKLLSADQFKHNEGENEGEKEGDLGNEVIVRGNVRVFGGKGGFGSMLRAIGAQIEKTTNREACRDLSGRRMRDINNEKAIGDWMEKQKVEEEDKARRKKEKLERILNPPRHILSDSTYVSEIKENAEKVDIALQQGLQKISSSGAKSSSKSLLKRHRAEDRKEHSKKHKMWLEFDSDESLDEDEDNQEDPINLVASPVDHTEAKEVSPTESSFGVTSKQLPTASDVAAKKFVPPSDMSVESASTQKDSLVDKKQESSGIEQDVKKSSSVENLDNAEKVDLQAASRAEDLEAYGLERLKAELMKHGLKCGGTLKQRAERLFLLKSTPIKELDKSLFAKASKKQPKS